LSYVPEDLDLRLNDCLGRKIIKNKLITAKGSQKMQRNSTTLVPSFISVELLNAPKNIPVFDKPNT